MSVRLQVRLGRHLWDFIHRCLCKLHLNLQKVVREELFENHQGQTDHLETRALPEGPGSVGGPMRCPWYLFHRLF
ncbi:unnamed protein product [Staurois parvus]|uniref:Uncharacterized protein n=1 Tax=Staurois parvus TaxID=386267 RepID=A0ABN9BQQ5_9NEOB|nr:unnamed protein product [Staurois parvus]